MNRGAAEPQGQSSPREVYLHRGTRAPELFAARTAERQAAYLLPHLRAGMDLLDCGSGPGSITLGLAQAVAPGSVVGIDIQPGQVEAARAAAAREGVSNVRFEVANAYELPFPDCTFDAVHSHAMVMFLKDPLRAFREMRRVLKPGGVLGVRDQWTDKLGYAPVPPLMEQYVSLWTQWVQHNGFLYDYPPRQRQLLLQAGFVDVRASADAESYATPDGLKWLLGVHLALMSPESSIVRTSLEQGWADEAQWEAIRAEVRAWAARPDAVWCYPWCQAIGWVPE